MEHNLYNGRVKMLPKSSPSYGFDNCTNEGQSNGYDIISHSLEHTPVSSVFFSKHNINVLQETICEIVFFKCKKRISKQSEIELKIIMKAKYLESLRYHGNSGIGNNQNLELFNEILNKFESYNMNNPLYSNSTQNVLTQVKSLNYAVLNYAIDNIVGNINASQRYYEDYQTLPMPFDYAQSTQFEPKQLEQKFGF